MCPESLLLKESIFKTFNLTRREKGIDFSHHIKETTENWDRIHGCTLKHLFKIKKKKCPQEGKRFPNHVPYRLYPVLKYQIKPNNLRAHLVLLKSSQENTIIFQGPTVICPEGMFH